MLRLIIFFFAFIASLHAYVHDGYGLLDTKAPGLTLVAGDYEPTFTDQVDVWAEELSESIPSPDVVDGNCLPVALELQRRIVDTGRSALIVVIELPENVNNHALVMYTSEPGGRFDYVIDNGFSTGLVSQPRALLNKGHLGGEYYGTCLEPNIEEATCKKIGLPY